MVNKTRLVCDYPWQDETGITVFFDSDFAGCVETRKSTSGACLLAGSHLRKHWRTTQKKTLASSSGEAELAAALKGAREGPGMCSAADDLG